MRRSKLMIVAAVGFLSIASWAQAADIQAGRATAQAECGQCHAARDWEGEDAPSLESLMHDIVAGKVRHPTKVDLNPTEIANVAAYWGADEK